MNYDKLDAKFLTADQLISKVFPNPNDDLPSMWMFYQESNKFPIIIIEKACLLSWTDCKEDEKRQLGARDGKKCLHIVHAYYGSEIETSLCEGQLIARWFDEPIIPHFSHKG